MAKDWMNSIRKMYQDKSIPEDGIVQEIVKKQAVEFSKGINKVFGEVNLDTPDYTAREILKLNTWQFSSAKNYNDLIALNNLLVDENGTIRPKSEFLKLAKGIVGKSAKYLSTEYNHAIASSQMARLWQEIQRDKHIFPFVKFLVVNDSHVSDICQPLTNVIVSADDPMLLLYFPPNHFNCRTTVTKLRRGVPTVNYTKPEIPEAFKNNVGKTLKIFTDENSYMNNTPIAVINKANDLFAMQVKEQFKEASKEVRKQLEEYKLKYPFYQKTENSLVEVSLWHDATEPRNLTVANWVADKYKKAIKLTPHTDGKFLERSNPEYLYDGFVADRKSPKGLNLKNLFRKAHNQQNCEVVIIDLENNTNSIDVIFKEVESKLLNAENYPKLKKVIVISKDGKKFREFIR